MIAFKFPLHFLHELLSKNLLVLTDNCNTKQWRIQGGARGQPSLSLVKRLN